MFGPELQNLRVKVNFLSLTCSLADVPPAVLRSPQTWTWLQNQQASPSARRQETRSLKEVHVASALAAVKTGRVIYASACVTLAVGCVTELASGADLAPVQTSQSPSVVRLRVLFTMSPPNPWWIPPKNPSARPLLFDSAPWKGPTEEAN